MYRRSSTLRGAFGAVLLAATCLLSAPLVAQTSAIELDRIAAPERAEGGGAVDIVFCLDASGSMKAMLDEVRARLWEVVNDFSRMTPTPELRVGLLLYGSHESSEDAGWIVKRSELTSSLDQVYDAMLDIETKGNREYVGWVLHEAVESMDWSDRRDALKIVLVAGNEQADQASEKYDFHDVVRDALADDIVVHALYAGRRDKAIEHRWNEIAEWGEGLFTAVRPSPDLTRVTTPVDGTLADLNDRLNATYVPYGPRGRQAIDEMVRRDEGAAEMGAQSLGSRVATKAGALYDASEWDLVDASANPDFDLAAVPVEDLPESIRYLGYADLLDLLDRKRAERDELRQRILRVDEERRDALEKASARGTGTGVVDGMRQAIRQQAESRGFASRSRTDER